MTKRLQRTLLSASDFRSANWNDSLTPNTPHIGFMKNAGGDVPPAWLVKTMTSPLDIEVPESVGDQQKVDITRQIYYRGVDDIVADVSLEDFVTGNRDNE